MRLKLSSVLVLSQVLFIPASWACHFDSTAAWTLPGFENPESAHYDVVTDTIYVSNVSGVPTAKDGNGFISTVSVDGKIKELRWVQGLNAPKGIRVFEGKLYVTDIDRVVVIDIAKKKVVKRYNFPKAKFLNDLAVDSAGTIYMSDTIGNAIYSISRTGEKQKFLSGKTTDGPNGIFIEGGKLYVAGWGQNVKPDFSTDTLGNLFSVDEKTKVIQAITLAPVGHLDGLEKDQHGDWIASDWMAGKILHISPKGVTRDLLVAKQGTADIGFVPKANLVIIPQMKENFVAAYILK